MMATNTIFFAGPVLKPVSYLSLLISEFAVASGGGGGGGDGGGGRGRGGGGGGGVVVFLCLLLHVLVRTPRWR